MNKILCLNSLVLKIIAIITMTLDHIGMALMTFYGVDPILNNIGLVFRYIGRLCLPIIIFLIIEGMKYTKNRPLYLLRISIIAFIILIAEIIMQYGLNLDDIAKFGNVFLDLLLIAVSIYFIENKNNIIKSLILIPIAYVILSTILESYEYNGITIYWLPYGFFMQYHIYSYVLGMLMYIFTKYLDIKCEKNAKLNNITTEQYKVAVNYKFRYNMFVCIALIITGVIFTALNYVGFPDIINNSIQSYAMLTCFILLFYNHKKGYSNKIIQYGFYLYYPVHIALIFLIFSLI